MAASLHSYVHFDLFSDRPEATRRFYETLFHWRFHAPGDQGRTVFEPPSPPNGALVDRRDAETPVPGILPYILVEDIHDARWRVREAAGAIHRHSIEIPGIAELCIFEAPGGPLHGLWESAPEAPETEREDEPAAASAPGSIAHVELRSGAPDATRTFFEEVFGWRFEEISSLGYSRARLPRPPNAGLIEAQPEAPLPSTLVYVTVRDVHAMVEAIEDAGGKLVAGPTVAEELGTGAVVQTPGGVPQGLWQPERAQG